MSESSPPRIEARNVTQRFGDVVALDDVSLSVDDGELVTLLGPSGCGKTTLLRIMGGLAAPVGGQVLLSGEDVTNVPAHKRPTHLVFQRPTMFPHLNVFDNIAFGLRIARVPKAELRPRVEEALALVRLPGYESRRSHELSGGQMQRISLARALANRPQVLLLDEPFSALDLKIRLEMEGELRRLHRETGTTIIFVTHDQREALALSDRIALFNHGRIEQFAPPWDIYQEPCSKFAAGFVGDANTLTAVVSGPDGATIGGQPVSLPGDRQAGAYTVVLRPEVVSLQRQDEPGPGLAGVVGDLAYRGSVVSFEVDIDGLDLPLRAELAASLATEINVGDAVRATWRETDCLVLDAQDAPA